MEENIIQNDTIRINRINEYPYKEVDLIYYINQQYQKQTGRMPLIIKRQNKNIIFYKDIINSFYNFLKEKQDNDNNKEEENEEEKKIDETFLDINENNIKYTLIQYYNGDGWVSLKEKEVIYIHKKFTFDNLKIMIKASILTSDNLELNKNFDKIKTEIEDIYKGIDDNQKINDDIDSNTNLNLVVLTANPLIGKEFEENEELKPNYKDLRTMNDFNIIPATIYDLFGKENKLKYTEFWPLTEETFKNVILDDKIRPKILHLVCKSIYKMNATNDKCDSSDYVNLVFEQSNSYITKLMDKNYFQEIFNDEKIKNKIQDIILIISTQLAQDVYDIFKNFGFKNILIQPTTLADLSFIADYNYAFYRDIILNLENSINEIYESALNVYINETDSPKFCCCFHKHNNVKCSFLKDIGHEFFNYNEVKKSIQELYTSIPHFCHLWPCKGDSLFHEENFCLHQNICAKFLKLSKKFTKNRIKKKDTTFYNFCCCLDPTPHNINHVFFKDFSEKEKNNRIKFRKSEIKVENKYIPNYKIMKVLVGYNQIVYDILKFFNTEKIYINVYGDNINNLKVLGNIIKEYYQERFNPKLEEKIEIKKKTTANNFYYNINIGKNNKTNNILSKSAFNMENVTTKSIEVIELNDNNKGDLDKIGPKINNIIYFIYIYDNNLIQQVFNYNNNNNKLVLFSKEKIINDYIKDNSIQIPVEKQMRKEMDYKKQTNNFEPNEFITFQHYDTIKNVLSKHF